MKNRRNIIESELPPQNPLDIWMKDGKFYRSTKKGWTLIEDQMEFTDSKLMYKSTATSGTIGVNKETGKASIYNDVTKEWSPLGGGLTETTWQELKNKRDAGKLTPGSLYRITDYQCTTTQENTRSAGHQFDIVLLALSENKLAEEGWAMMNESNVYSIEFADNVTKDCFVYMTDENEGNIILCDTLLGGNYTINSTPATVFNINFDTKTGTTVSVNSTDLTTEDLTYNYFQNSNLSAWKVWYCLDNDTDRFAWADDSVDDGSPASIVVNDTTYIRNTESDAPSDPYPYAWENGSTIIFTESSTPSTNDNAYDEYGERASSIGTISQYTPPTQDTGLPNGRGVIYRLIDEWNNDVGYDFKNIQFVRPMTDGNYDPDNGVDTWVYTFSHYNEDNLIIEDGSISIPDIGATSIYNIVKGQFELNNNVLFDAMYCEISYDSRDLTLTLPQSIVTIGCEQIDIIEDSQAIYLHNKKVLTEE